MKTGIIGASGVVGQHMYKMFPDSVCYDKLNPVMIGWFSSVTNKVEQRQTTMEDINGCELAIVCVPTPLKNGKLDTSIVEEVVKECQSPLILIRSTMMPGTCDKLEKMGKNIVFQPEYIGETTSHPIDEKTIPFMILGGKPENRRKIIELYQSVYNANIKIKQVSNLEAEVIKLSENRAIAFKVAQCQELYDACEKAGVDYYTIRDAVYGDDPRFNLWFSFVYPEKRGFDSKCIPKDVYGWSSWAEKPELTESLLKYNEKMIGGTSD